MNEKKALTYALIAVLFWSSVATAFKIALMHLSIISMLTLASVSSFICISIICAKELKNLKFLNKKEIFYAIILGIINPLFYYLVLFRAYDLLLAQEAQAINYTWALVLSYFSVFFLKHKFSKFDFFAGIIAYSGVFIIATKGDILSFNFTSLKGVLYALLSTVLWASYWIFSQKLSKNANLSLWINFLVGSICLIFLFIFTNQNINIKGLFAGIYIGVFEMGITFFLWLRALSLTKHTAKIANLIFLSPFLSLVFIHFILGEKIAMSTFLGLFLIIFALLYQKHFNKPKKHLTK